MTSLPMWRAVRTSQWSPIGAVFDWVREVPAGALSRAAKCSVTAALSLVGLCKSFGLKRAVDHLDLEVRRGCMFGLVGPNGAGKTTTLSMATGLLRPDAGTARVLDHDVWADPAAAKALMGVLPDGLRLFDRLSGAELLRYVGLLRRVSAAEIATRSAELLDALALTDDRDTLVVEYSAGMTKKIGLACALIHAPRLLILDEPFEAVDPVSGEVIRSILRNYAHAGGTVVEQTLAVGPRRNNIRPGAQYGEREQRQNIEVKAHVNAGNASDDPLGNL